MIGRNGWGNIAAIYGMKAVEFGLPWIYLPMLVRIIGPELFGVLALATALSQYFLILTEFGYQFSGVRSVALIRDDIHRLQEFVSTVVQLRLVVAAGSTLVVAAVTFLLDLSPEIQLVIVASCASVFGVALSPQFLLQGLEQFKLTSFLNVIVRSIAVITILVVVRTDSDYVLVPIVHAASSLLGGLFLMTVVMSAWGIRVRPVPVSKVVNEFRLQKGMVMAGMAISLYTSTNTLILGVFSNPFIVGYYAAGEKLVRALQQVFLPLQTVLMPKVAMEAKVSPSMTLAKLNQLFIRLMFTIIPASFLLCVFAREIVVAVFGAEFSPASTIIRILCPLPMIMIGTLVCTDLFLLGFGYSDRWRSIINWSAFVGIVLAFLSAGWLGLGAEGMAGVLLLTEGMIAAWSARYFRLASRERDV